MELLMFSLRISVDKEFVYCPLSYGFVQVLDLHFLDIKPISIALSAHSLP